ncbi:helix-turn-helix transcriptional regulator [Cohnella faecalis]|uniref:AraC family transcriptional regulator n=1 Tax=Cohnella faecalis TaxID=2315694 RepID=A0A398CSK9_9BACL|nr:AraC family transcriptional regulator [Cohnella faecalis]RIE02361.1 AraC family transcriptional regulator [Cohnella faecalis]
MELQTVGRIHHEGYRHSIWYNDNENLNWNDDHHSRYKLVLVLEGSGLVEHASSTYPIIAQSIFCLNESEQLRLTSGSGLIMKSLYFHPHVVNSKFTLHDSDAQNRLERDDLSTSDIHDVWCLGPFFDRQEPFYGCTPIDSAVARHAFKIMESINGQLTDQPDFHWPCRSRSYLLELLFLVSRIYREAESFPDRIPPVLSSKPDSSEQLESIVRYVHTHYREKLKIDDICKKFHTNKTTLNNQFKQYAGISVMGYLNQIRMQMASSMLRNTLLPKHEIMEMVGIHDSAHFLRNFRKFAGYSPSEYRKSFCWMLQNR